MYSDVRMQPQSRLNTSHKVIKVILLLLPVQVFQMHWKRAWDILQFVLSGQTLLTHTYNPQLPHWYLVSLKLQGFQMSHDSHKKGWVSQLLSELSTPYQPPQQEPQTHLYTRFPAVHMVQRYFVQVLSCELCHLWSFAVLRKSLALRFWARISFFQLEVVPLERDPKERNPWAFISSQSVHLIFLCPVVVSGLESFNISWKEFFLHVHIGQAINCSYLPSWGPSGSQCLSEDTQSFSVYSPA